MFNVLTLSLLSCMERFWEERVLLEAEVFAISTVLLSRKVNYIEIYKS